MRKIILLLLLVPAFGSLKAQEKIDVNFIKHLVDKQYFQESLLLLNENRFSGLPEFKLDSLNYYKGWAYYSLKKLNESANSLLRVSANSSFYNKSRFFAAYNYIHIGDHDLGNNILQEYSSDSRIYNSLRNFELAGSALLNKRYDEFKAHMSKVDTSYFNLSNESANLFKYSKELQEHKRKSPFVAGLMSAIIPGAGKMYAGKVGSGISGLITVGGFAAVTWENYHKRGLKDYRTIILGSIFSVFYIGNIYGSYMSVKVNEIEYENEYQNKILFNLHIPLRNIFN